MLGVHAETPPPADDILAFVRSRLPDDPLRLTGSLKVKTKNGSYSGIAHDIDEDGFLILKKKKSIRIIEGDII